MGWKRKGIVAGEVICWHMLLRWIAWGFMLSMVGLSLSCLEANGL